METTIEMKRSKAHSVLKLALFLSATMLVGTILLVILSKAAGTDILEAIGADLLGGRSSSDGGMPAFITAMLMLTMGIAQFIYAQRIGKLAAANPDAEEYQPLKHARNGAYIQLAALVLLVLTPLLGKALASTDSIVIVFVVLILPWVTAVAGTIMMRIGFKSLSFCGNATGSWLQGVEDLRHTATYQLRLLFMPLVLVLFSTLMILLFLSSMKGIWDGSGFYALSLDQLFESINDIKGRGDSTISTLCTFYYIYAIALAVFMFFIFLWFFFMLVKPITGWNRFMKSLTAEENTAETGTGGNHIADLLERLRNWHYYVAAGVIVALIFSPLFMGSNKDRHAVESDDMEIVESDDMDIAEREHDEAEWNTASGEVTGFETDFDADGDVIIIMAHKGGASMNTGIEVEGFLADISDQHDYDGDGNMDALVSWSMGVGYPGNMFIAYYDKDAGRFKRTEDFEPGCTSEQKDGVWTVLYKTSTEKKRYKLVRGQLVTIEHETVDTGDEEARITIETVFGDSLEPDMTGEYSVDLNDDGTDETFTFTVGYYRFGAIMYCDGFTSDGTTYEFPGQGTLVVLKNKTRGWHDVMWENVDLDERYLFRWTGNGYEKVSL